jgi:YD repeat-containing protein
LRKCFLISGFLCLLISFTLSGFANAQGAYRYEYDENNKLIKIFKDNETYMTFDYDKNGNLIKKESWLKPPTNIQAEVLEKNSVRLSWEAVPEAISYQIFLKSENETKALEVASTNNTFIEFNKLNINTNYSFVLKSQSENGIQSAESNVISITLDLGDQLVNPIKGILTKESFPIPSIQFSIHTLDGTTWYDANSGKYGGFELRLPDGNYQIDGIWIESDGLWFEKYQQFTVFNGKLVANDILSVILNESIVTGTLKKGTELLPNVSFNIQSQTGEKRWYQVESDQSGNFSFNLPSGLYKLEGVWLDTENRWYELNKEFVAQGDIQFDINVLEPDGSILEGTLKKGEIILSNIQFSIRSALGDEWYSIQTDENGNFSKVIPDGTYILEGVWLESERSWYELQKEFSIKGKFQLSINVLDSIHGNLIGMVKKGTQPVPETIFSICSTTDGKWYDAKTDHNGNFEFKVPNDTYTIAGIWVKSENKWYELNQSFTVTDSLNIDIDILDFTITIRSNSEN